MSNRAATSRGRRSGAVGTAVASHEPRQTMVSKLRDGLLALIEERGLRPGDRIPTEAEICDHFGVARSTAREALQHLEQEGIVHAVHGQGRFLSPIGSLGIVRPITKYEGITEMLEGLGYRVTDAVLDVSEWPAEQVQAEALDIAVGDPLIRLVRIRFGNDEPMVFSIGYLLRDALPGPLRFRDWTGSILRALEAHGHFVTSSAAKIRAVNLPDEFSRRYDLGEFDPWLLTEETCLTQEGLRVMYAEDYFRGDVIGFNVLRRR